MEGDRLRILHCFRSPVGGIFRHVRDLVHQHAEQGHEIGIFCDSLTGGAHEEKLFEEIRPKLSLGLTRIPMRRAITPGDLLALHRSYRHFKQLKPDVLHSHGAKGGAYARIIGSLLRVSGLSVARLYCPHGGSIHYDPATLKGKLFFTLEGAMERLTDRLIFVSEYERKGYEDKIGMPHCATSLIYNGLSPAEYAPVATARDAADFLYIGMMRDLKGPDVFLDALAVLRQRSQKVTAHFVGDGPDKPRYVERIAALGLGDAVSVHAAMPARAAFAMARTVVVPSRAESMPYLVLEAIAAAKPVISTRVGGIPEIFGAMSGELVVPGSADALADAMQAMLHDQAAEQRALTLRDSVKERFSVDVMARDIMAAYRASL
ncbi:MAG: glycosyltransferase family 4 protein [Nitratireductor sp.]|nr:glycosyltransferase family 4 protein [Nitratireductor sp.]